MAIGNLYISADTKYDPMSFEDFARPYMMYKQEFDKQQDALGELDTKASVWEGMADKEKDPVAYAKYKAYADNLREAAHSLATEGLSAGSRSRLMALRGDYSSRITPIENAYNRKKELSDEQRKMIAQNPTMLYQRMANNMSLDDFIANPQADYGQQYNGALLTQQVSQAAANLAKEARDSTEGKGKLYKLLLPYQYEYVRQKGFDHKAVMQAIMDSPHADRILTGLVDSAINTSGVLNWGDENTIRRAYDYARQGLYNAIGETQSQIIKDDFSATDELNKRQHERQTGKSDKKELGDNFPFNPIALRSPKELDEWNKQLDDFTKDGLINVDRKTGKIFITNKGKKALYGDMKSSATAVSNKATPTVVHSTEWNGNMKFRQFMNALVPGENNSIYAEGYTAQGAPTGKNTRKVGEVFLPSEVAAVMRSLEPGTRKYSANPSTYDLKQFLSKSKDKSMKDKVMQVLKEHQKTIQSGKAFDWTDNAYIDRVYNEALARGYKQHLEGSYDTYHSTEYGYQLSKEQGEAWMDAILADALGEGKLNIVEFAGQSGFKKEDDIDLDDLVDAGYTVSQVRPSKWGNTAILMPDKDSGKEPIRVSLPKGINKRIMDNYGKAIENADYWGNRLSNAGSDAEAILAKQKQKQAFNDLGSFVNGTVVVLAGSTPVRQQFYY